MELKNKNRYTALYDYYQKLLTAKQQEYFGLYFFEDYSLTEIANFKNVTKNAVYDSICKIIKMMNKFENILILKNKQIQREKLYKDYENKIDKDFIFKLRKIDELDDVLYDSKLESDD